MLCISIHRKSYIDSKPLRGHGSADVRAEALGATTAQAMGPEH